MSTCFQQYHSDTSHIQIFLYSWWKRDPFLPLVEPYIVPSDIALGKRIDHISTSSGQFLSSFHAISYSYHHQKAVHGIDFESGTPVLISRTTTNDPYYPHSRIHSHTQPPLQQLPYSHHHVSTPSNTFLLNISTSHQSDFDSLIPKKKRCPSNRSPVQVRGIPLSAAKRLAKLCQDTHNRSSSSHRHHKASLYAGQTHFRPALAAGLLSPIPVISKHLKRRRARADSFSSSSSESSSSSQNQHIKAGDQSGDVIMQYHQQTHQHYIHTPTVAGIADHLSRSLRLEKCAMQTLPAPSLALPHWATSPSAESTCSEHSLFSDQSHLTHVTNMSSRPASRNDAPAHRLGAAHPSAHRILSLHEHSPGTTPKDSYMEALPHLSYLECDPTNEDMEAPFDDPSSRYFARRNAIAPLADPVPQPVRRGSSAFGPMRTAKALKTARGAAFGVSQVGEIVYRHINSHKSDSMHTFLNYPALQLAVPELPRPFSPPPRIMDRRSSVHQLIVPQRRMTLPMLRSKLNSPVKLAKLVMPSTVTPACSQGEMDSPEDEESDDLDFCCKGYESPIVAPPFMGHYRQNSLFSPYRRNSLAGNVSQLGKRRGKTVPRLKLR